MKNGVTSTFEYGSDGLRRKMVVDDGQNPPVTTHYVLDRQNVVRELDGSLDPKVTYLTGPRGIEYRWDHTAQQGEERRWYLYDGLGCVIGEVDDNGELQAQRTYYAFGAVRPGSDQGEGKQRFCGSLGHTADDTGLTYMRARYYDPVIGRFISEDPGLQGQNWYAYCWNNPTSAGDWSGKNAFGIAAFCMLPGLMAVFSGLMLLYADPSPITSTIALTTVASGMACMAAEFFRSLVAAKAGGSGIQAGVGTIAAAAIGTHCAVIYMALMTMDL